MKIFTIIFVVIAFAVCIYNATLIDFSNPFEGDSIVAVIGVLASLCAVILIVILSLSKKIQLLIKQKSNV